MSATETKETKEKRVIFISATYLSQEYQKVPPKTLASSLFFFGSKRSWIFPSNERERSESKLQPTDYDSFETKFLELIQEKEKIGYVYWLKPEQNYEKVSAWLTTIDDPITGSKYKPLILDEKWWLTEKDGFISKQAYQYTKATAVAGRRIVTNYKTGDHDYSATLELLYQSNPTLIPVLSCQSLIG